MSVTTSTPMRTATIGGHELAYRVTGTGEPVVLVHGAFAAELMAPIEQADALRGSRRVLYHRQGHGRSPRPQPVVPLTLADQAADLVGLLDELDLGAAHLVGHSGGALIALTAAAAHAERVISLSLLEPLVPLAHPAGTQWLESALPTMERYAGGDVVGATSDFFDVAYTEGWRERMDRLAPGAFDDTVDGAAMAFESDVPGLVWNEGLTADQVAAVRCPVLHVLGSRTRPVFTEAREVLHGWFPWCEDVDIEGADHMLPVLEPEAVGAAVAGFVQRAGRDRG